MFLLDYQAKIRTYFQRMKESVWLTFRICISMSLTSIIIGITRWILEYPVLLIGYGNLIIGVISGIIVPIFFYRFYSQGVKISFNRSLGIIFTSFFLSGLVSASFQTLLHGYIDQDYKNRLVEYKLKAFDEKDAELERSKHIRIIHNRERDRELHLQQYQTNHIWLSVFTGLPFTAFFTLIICGVIYWIDQRTTHLGDVRS
jgi:hypothetical protein